MRVERNGLYWESGLKARIACVYLILDKSVNADKL